MANLWKQFERLTNPPAPRWVATVIQETAPGQYQVALLPSGATVNVTGSPSQYAVGARVIVQATEIVDQGPTGSVVLVSV